MSACKICGRWTAQGPGPDLCEACGERANRAVRDAAWKSAALARCPVTNAGHVMSDLATSEGAGQRCLACGVEIRPDGSVLVP